MQNKKKVRDLGCGEATFFMFLPRILFLVTTHFKLNNIKNA
jgi:hypothetical protein